MNNFYFNLSGGINQSSTKTELGMNTKNIYWADAENVEIYQSKGIIRQKGNILLTEIPNNEEIIGIHEMKSGSKRRLIIVTKSGKLYIYKDGNPLVLIDKQLTSNKITFTNFLNGTIVAGDNNEMFFIKNNENYDIVESGLKKSDGSEIHSTVVTIFKGRVWVADGSTIYFSALGSFEDFSTPDDAGYISDFHTDTNEILALKTYKDYLAIYKEDYTYILSGSNPNDFAITPFADKGAYSQNAIVSVNNRQYFYSSGIYTLEVGELNQIQLGSEITRPIVEEFKNFDFSRRNEVLAINYETKNQVWYFIPYKNDQYFHTIWINDIIHKAWYKRVLPQDITTACIFEKNIYTADKNGKIYVENMNNSFDGAPIEFLWKSPFLSLGDPTMRKTIDEFYFILDESHENNFTYSIFKNYDSESKDDTDYIYSTNTENLIWTKENTNVDLNDEWPNEKNEAIWALDVESMYKAEISEANYAIQLCVEGDKLENNLAIIGLQFKEIYSED